MTFLVTFLRDFGPCCRCLNGRILLGRPWHKTFTPFPYPKPPLTQNLNFGAYDTCARIASYARGNCHVTSDHMTCMSRGQSILRGGKPDRKPSAEPTEMLASTSVDTGVWEPSGVLGSGGPVCRLLSLGFP